ncbi:GatB/YqeY domain-containing protein [Arthrobacter castelli]|uniref:GatB/YqeY domain-containing protein n=1 Tax=Arthrobacter castelli TaxID=271431 RepID=UPI000423714D|nr:GatB/YqeY domain-containing protein [Arthrobacter castelli]
MRDTMRRDLKTAMKARDRVAVTAIRSALAAIDNAEAIPVERSVAENGTAEVAASAVGIGAAEADRRDLDAEDMRAIVEAEVNDRTAVAGEYEQAGHSDAGDKLRAEADVLRGYLPPGP